MGSQTLRSEIYLCTVLAILFLIMGSSLGQIAEFEKRGRGPAGSMEPPIVLGSSSEPQGLLPSIETVQFQTEEGWSSWTLIKGRTVTTSPAVASPENGAVDIFMGGANDELWHVRHYKVWSTWDNLFGSLSFNTESQGVPFRKYELAAVYTGTGISNGNYHIFTWGPTGHCLYKKCEVSEDGIVCDQECDWIRIDGEINSRPATVILSSEIYLFALDTAGGLLWNRADIESSTGSYDGLDWEGWSHLQGPFKSSPTAVSDGKDIHIFILNEIGEIAHIIWCPDTGEISDEIIDYKMRATPSAVISGNRIHLFGIEGRDLIHTWYDGNDWQDWENLGGELIGQPAAVSDRSDRIRIFGRGPGDKLWEIDYNL